MHSSVGHRRPRDEEIRWIAMLRIGIAFLLLTHVAHADTRGYLRATPIADEVTLDKPKGPPRVVVARTQVDWVSAWKAAGGTGAAKAIDFERFMVVGVVNGAKDDRVVYRIQLDDAANAKALEVHLGTGDGPTWSGRTRKRTGAHFVVTPRSALAVRFVRDQMVDGRVEGNTGENIDSTEVATVAAVVVKPKGVAALREAAERAVVAQLTPAERKQLLENEVGLMKRIPHGWTDLGVVRETDRWVITYDKLVFRVDVATGAVTR
jgi:hypothetical protein